MPIQSNSDLKSAVANATFLDKTQDDATVAKISMNNPNSANIDDPQNYINELGDTTGQAGEGDANRKNYSSTNYIANGDNRKVALEKLDAQVFTNRTDINSNDSDITALDGRVTTNEGDISTLQTEVQAIEDDYGQPNGLATLDGTGRLPNSQLPVEAFEFKGAFDASGGGSGSPSLTDGTGTTGDLYKVTLGGTVDHGAGSVTYASGDQVWYDGTVWNKSQTSDNSAPVDSVFSRIGAVVAQSGDYNADQVDETTSRYWDVKNNFTATVDPTATDDSTLNYVAGSRWYNQTNNKFFVCESNTASSAVWTNVSATATPSFTTVTKTANATLATTGEDNVLADSTSGDITLTLPAASGNSGLTYKITKIQEANKVTIDGNGTETIGGELTTVMATKDDSIIITCDGSNWYFVSDDVVHATRYTSNAGQAMPNGAITLVTYEDLDFDTHAIYNNSTGVGTILIDGYYSINAIITYGSFFVGPVFTALYVNATLKARGPVYYASADRPSSSYSDIVYLNKGDTFDIRGFQSSGASRNLWTTDSSWNFLSLARVK